MNEKYALTPIQQKAVSLREFIGQDRIKEQFMAALPRTIDKDRFFRILQTAIMENPQIAECTVPSVLSAFIKMAQLGLEPILGRCALIPRKNRRKPGEPLELNFQPMYQGLIHLTRNTGKLKNISAHVVYEKDEFNMELEPELRIEHKPSIFEADRGGKRGAYAKWVWNDGTRSYHVMSIHDIYKHHRSRSESYRAYQKAKSQGRDMPCPWVDDEDEMIKKTIIIQGSKLQELSVEAHEAIRISNQVEAGETLDFGPETGFSLPDPEDIGKPQPTTQETFDEKFKDLIVKVGVKTAEEFLTECAKAYDTTLDNVMATAIQDPSDFERNLLKYAAQSKKLQQPKQGGDDGDDDQDELFAPFKNLRTDGFKKKVEKEIQEILKYPVETQNKIRQKWSKYLPNVPFPQPEEVESAPPPPQQQPPETGPIENLSADAGNQGTDQGLFSDQQKPEPEASEPFTKMVNIHLAYLGPEKVKIIIGTDKPQDFVGDEARQNRALELLRMSSDKRFANEVAAYTEVLGPAKIQEIIGEQAVDATLVPVEQRFNAIAQLKEAVDLANA